MRLSVEWLDDAENADPEERATVGNLRLHLSDEDGRDVNATAWECGEDRGDCLTIATYGLVHGLVHDWWSVLGAREGETSLQKFRTGYLVPDIRISSDGEEFWFVCHPGPCFDSDITFTCDTSEIVSRREGVKRLTEFVERVLDRLDDKDLRESDARLRWDRITRSHELGEGPFCEAVGALGLDPYEPGAQENAGGIADFVGKAEEVFRGEALVEFVAGSKGEDQARLMSWVEEETSAPRSDRLLADLRPITRQFDDAGTTGDQDPAWARGYRRARAMRTMLGLEESDRVGSFEKLAELMGAPRGFAPASSPRGIVGLRQEGSGGIHVNISEVESFHAPTTHLFALGRMVGDAACFTDPETSAVNGLTNAYRQAAGRAFAAEFIAPVNEVLSMSDSGRDDSEIAGEFGVSPHVVKHQLENRDRIARVCHSARRQPAPSSIRS